MFFIIGFFGSPLFNDWPPQIIFVAICEEKNDRAKHCWRLPTVFLKIAESHIMRVFGHKRFYRVRRARRFFVLYHRLKVMHDHVDDLTDKLNLALSVLGPIA